MPAARHFGLGVLPYFPLANGLLTGKVRKGQAPPPGSRLAGRPGYLTESKLDRVEALISWAAERGLTVLEVAVGALAAGRLGRVLAGRRELLLGVTAAVQAVLLAAAVIMAALTAVPVPVGLRYALIVTLAVAAGTVNR